MSDDEDLKTLREQRMAERAQQQQSQHQQEAMQAQQQQSYEAQKQMLLAQILSSDARARLANIKLARSEFAETLEMQLIQAYQSGSLRGKIPLNDEYFKSLLLQLQNNTQKRERKISFR
ncbi:MAG: DNA-binding protein [Promethearchaeota archaeon]|nr:MAG: DNA-binding protein [Candidatus Lokiarchaeota archaeon]